MNSWEKKFNKGKKMKTMLLTAVLAMTMIFMPSESKANDPHQYGEKLVYEVSFMGMTIGTIETYTMKNQTIKGDKTHHVRSKIKSAKGIPYVDLDVEFDSWMDPSFAYSHKFMSTSVSDGTKVYEEALFDYDNNTIDVTMTKNGKKVQDFERELNRKVNDGCSLFFMARKYMDRNKTVKVPTYIEDENSLTVINFHNRVETAEVDAIDYPVRTKYLNGTAKWEGLYGLSGDFEGWFSDDEAAVPIRAKMNVYVGTVNIELVSWDRDGWTPPKASS
jgi:hypothetical protein